MFKPKGLKNIGNTCYLNAGLQMLLQNEEFCDLVHTWRDVNNDMENFAVFIEIYRISQTNDSLVPDFVRNIVVNHHERFEGTKQQDSQEFIDSLMNILNIYTDNAFINLFQIRSKQIVQCLLVGCFEKTETPILNNFLILPIVPDNLTACYKKYKKPERLVGDNEYFCQRCQVKREASQHFDETIWPKHLIVFLKRFIYNGVTSVKNETPIVIPISWRHGYMIQGCIIHYGDINGGHYRYISRIIINGFVHWYKCDDSSVKEITEDDAMNLINTEGYIIYYKKDV